MSEPPFKYLEARIKWSIVIFYYEIMQLDVVLVFLYLTLNIFHTFF